MPTPAALPVITSLYAGLCGILLVVLSLFIVRLRWKYRISLGDRDKDGQEIRELQAAVRVHGNFSEHVPLALILVGILEMIGYPSWVVHSLGALLVLARLSHAWGITTRPGGPSPGRGFGVISTWLILLVAGILAILAGAGGAALF
jgi:uncharacterized protein